jgi:hypothetical protein
MPAAVRRVPPPATLLAALCVAAPVAGQAPPGTDVWLAPLSTRDGALQVGPLRNLTARPGYDNQPSFSPDGRHLFLTTIGPDGQADVQRVEVRTGAATAVTATPESEYSPAVIPGGRELAVIRVERDSAQRLWAFPLRGGPPRLLLPGVRPVGYQAWVGPGEVGLFVLGAPATLHVADLATGASRPLLADIGRSLTRVPGRRALAVTQRVARDVWWLVEVDVATAAVTPIVRMPEGADFVAWLPDGSLLTARGTDLLRHRRGDPAGWVPVASLAAPGLGRLSRLAVSPRGDWLAVVADEPR